MNAFNLVTTDGATPTTPGLGTPVVVGNFANSLGGVQRVANGVVYLPDLRQIPDPSIASISSATIRGISAMRAITDANGAILLRNPLPGEFGTLSQGYLKGPGLFRLDFNLLKRIRITERTARTLRADATRGRVQSDQHAVFRQSGCKHQLQHFRAHPRHGGRIEPGDHRDKTAFGVPPLGGSGGFSRTAWLVNEPLPAKAGTLNAARKRAAPAKAGTLNAVC